MEILNNNHGEEWQQQKHHDQHEILLKLREL